MRAPSVGFPSLALHLQQRQHQHNHQLTPSANLLVKYLPGSIDKKQLENFFTPFGAIKHAKTIKNKEKCLGYGFVKFNSIDAAIRAERHFSSITAHLSPFSKIQFARPSESHKLSLLSFCGISANFSLAEIIDIFEVFGPVCQSNISWSATGWTGTIRLETPTQAQAAVDALNNWICPDSTRPVFIKLVAKNKNKDPFFSDADRFYNRTSVNPSAKALSKPPMFPKNTDQCQQKSPKASTFTRQSPDSFSDSKMSHSNSYTFHKHDKQSEVHAQASQRSSKIAEQQNSTLLSHSQKNTFSNSSRDVSAGQQTSARPPNIQKDSFSTWSSGDFFNQRQISPGSTDIQQNNSWNPSSNDSCTVCTHRKVETNIYISTPSNSSIASNHSNSASKSSDSFVDVIAQQVGNYKSISSLFDQPVEPVQRCRFVDHRDDRIPLHLLFGSLELKSSRSAKI